MWVSYEINISNVPNKFMLLAAQRVYYKYVAAR